MLLLHLMLSNRLLRITLQRKNHRGVGKTNFNNGRQSQKCVATVLFGKAKHLQQNTHTG